MTITLSFGNFVLLLIAIAVIVAVFYLVHTLIKIRDFLTKVEILIPEARDVLRNSSDVLKRAQSLLEEGEKTVCEVRKSTSVVKNVIEEVTSIVEDTLLVFKPISFFASGIRNGLKIFKNLFKKDEDKKEE